MRKQGLWLCGVLVGLAIRQALVQFTPQIVAPGFAFDRAAWLEISRLALFLLMVIRFYLGAVAVFRRPLNLSPRRIDGIDLLSAVAHLLLFFAWAETIHVDINNRWLVETVSPYMFFLGCILIYDLFWWLVTRDYEHLDKQMLWMTVNLTTLGGCALIQLGFRAFKGDAVFAEELCFVVVAFFSIVDLAELVTGKEIFRRFFHSL
ncbi:MAG: hypothetical protein ACRD2L_26300 [Terriglobia bacterium]